MNCGCEVRNRTVGNTFANYDETYIHYCTKHAAVDRLVAALRMLKQVAFDGPPTPMSATEYIAWKRAADTEAGALLAEIEEASRE